MSALTTIAIALDLGTTSIKSGLLDETGQLAHITSRPAPAISVSGGKYESDALAYASIADAVLGEMAGQSGSCRRLGVCSQRSTFVVWEKATGLPVTPLISWQDDRGAARCAALKDYEKIIRQLSGLPLAPYYFAPKLDETLRQNPAWVSRLRKGELLVGTLDTFLFWRWSRGNCHATDVSMAARTLLMDIQSAHWSEVLCQFFDIPIRILPDIRPSAAMNIVLDDGMILAASVGDQSAALVSSVSDDGQDVLVNLGTGCFVVRFGGEASPRRKGLVEHGYLNTLVYQDDTGKSHFASEGTLNSVAPVLARYPVESCKTSDLASNEILCISEPNGLGAPFFLHGQFSACHSDPRQVGLGIQFSQPVDALAPRQIAALLLESVIFRVTRILQDFHFSDPIERVYLSGGLSELECLQHGIAVCAPCDVFKSQQHEASLLGAGLLAAGRTITRRQGELVNVSRDRTSKLYEKYLRWNDWLDALLAASH
jgi:glycerol kinase